MLQGIKHIAGNSGKYCIRQQDSLGTLNGYVEEMMEGQKVVKVFTHEGKVKEQFRELNDELAKNTASANQYANILMPTMGNLGNLQYILIAIFGGALAIHGKAGLTLGIIASFLQLSKSITQPLGQISQQLNMVVMALAGAGRIFEFLDLEPEQDDGFVTLVNAKYDDKNELIECRERTNIWAWKYPREDGSIELVGLNGIIDFHNVDFSYVPGKPVLHDISLWAEKGDKLAFVGATGAGKTTITNLINRFYDIDDGEILYDGIDISKIRKPDLRRSLGVVLQDTNLFSGTIADNIRYGRKTANDDEVRAAAQLANAHSFISRLPEGYNTVIDGSGEGLSQGQRQLLSIARAAVADPPVMILDEATSSIDTRTEILVQNGMDALMYGRTVFVIAHRLSTIKNADVIMVLDHGRIMERGNHDKLMTEQGIYYQLYTGAFELGDFD